MSAADWTTGARLVLIAVMWPLALAGEGLVLGIGLIAAALTDALDGFLARRSGSASGRGARLDALADTALMLSVAAWLAMLHPEVVRGLGVPLLAAAGLYAASVAASWTAFRRLVDPRQLSAKATGGLLYLFALVTLLTGVFVPALLAAALVALAASSAETIFTATRTIHANARASRTRSHAPQAPNEVASSARPTASAATSATPSARERRP